MICWSGGWDLANGLAVGSSTWRCAKSSLSWCLKKTLIFCKKCTHANMYGQLFFFVLILQLGSSTAIFAHAKSLEMCSALTISTPELAKRQMNRWKLFCFRFQNKTSIIQLFPRTRETVAWNNMQLLLLRYFSSNSLVSSIVLQHIYNDTISYRYYIVKSPRYQVQIFMAIFQLIDWKNIKIKFLCNVFF